MTSEQPHAISNLLSISTPTALVALQWVDRGATELAAIKGFKNLKVLDLAGNKLTQAVQELKTLKFLNKLSLARNQIREMWELPTQLEHLNLAHNQIEELSLHLPRLRTLDISHNHLRSLLGIRHLLSLTSLYASNNLLSDVRDLDRLPHLIEADLSSNLLRLEVAVDLFAIPSLSALNLRDNPEAGDLTPPEEWIQDKDLLFYRHPNRLKDLKTSRFRREIKRKQESVEIAQESFSQSPSKRNGSSDSLYEANSSTRKFRREAFALRQCTELSFESRVEAAGGESLRRKPLEALFEEVIEYCKLPLQQYKDSWERYERAADMLKGRERERLDAVQRQAELESLLKDAKERWKCNVADLESALVRMEAGYLEQIQAMNQCLGELQLRRTPETREAEVSFLLDFHTCNDVRVKQSRRTVRRRLHIRDTMENRCLTRSDTWTKQAVKRPLAVVWKTGKC